MTFNFLERIVYEAISGGFYRIPVHWVKWTELRTLWEDKMTTTSQPAVDFELVDPHTRQTVKKNPSP